MKAVAQRELLLETLATLGDWADLVCDEDSPREVIRIVAAFSFLTGLLAAQGQPQLAATLLASASEQIPDALAMARELTQQLAKK